MRNALGISSGDPSGIGLEVILKALPAFLNRTRWVLFTDRSAFDRHYIRFGNGMASKWIDRPSEADAEGTLFLIDVPGSTCPIPWGDIQPVAGQRALAYLRAASDAALAGDVAGVVTAPVNKAAIGRSFIGQTEFLADLAATRRFAMAFFTPTFKVVLATVHLSLRDALAMISIDLYTNLIRLVAQESKRFASENPRIAVAGINPHAGEGGMFGREEIDILEPAVRICAEEGIKVTGPYSADSLYYRAHSGEFDIVIAPYHDQGLAPVKLIAHGASTNVTLGLPYIRTSPDHGTALSIAGRGVADPAGMIAAMQCALDLCGKSQASA